MTDNGVKIIAKFKDGDGYTAEKNGKTYAKKTFDTFEELEEFWETRFLHNKEAKTKVIGKTVFWWLVEEKEAA
jgi:hypothetical protein